MGYFRMFNKLLAGLAVLDITNPAARKWYSDKLSALMDLGVDAFKVG